MTAELLEQAAARLARKLSLDAQAAEDEAARAEIDLAARFGLAALDHRDLG